MNVRIIPPGMPFPQALRLGYTGEIRMPRYLAWIRSLPCRYGHAGKAQASHPNFFKSQTRKGPDPLALPECAECHENYERWGDPQETERLAAAALYMLQAIHEGRLRWVNLPV